MQNREEFLKLLKIIDEKENISQRSLSNDLNISLGKINYCIKALKDKGLIKLKNFAKRSNKISYLQYVVTPKGISFRTKLTINFMKKKMMEYDELRQELNKLNKKGNIKKN